MIYLDHNATAPLHPAARAAMLPWLGRPANPMSAHAAGRAAAAAIDQARARVAALTGWPRESVFFTSGATEANAWALHTGRWAASAVEHPSVLARAAALLPVDRDGRAWPDPALPLPDGLTGISIQLANNETGVLQPIPAWAAFCAARSLRLHVDASQGPGRVPVRDIPCDLLTLSAHKAGGPAGVGALLMKKPWPPPLLPGGPQERAQRAGTHNVAGIAGMGAAFDALQGRTLSPDLRDQLEAALITLGGRVASADAPRLPNTACVAFDNIDAQDLVLALDLDGICVSAGSACASGASGPSHVLRAMGFPGSAVRFSLGEGTTEEEIARVVGVMGEVVGRLRG